MASKRDVKRELVSLCIVYLLCILALYFTHLFNHMHICLVQHVRICKDVEGHAYTLCILNSMGQLFIIGRWVFCPLGIMPQYIGWVCSHIYFHLGSFFLIILFYFIFIYLFIYFFNWGRTSPKQDSLDPFLESKLWIYVPTH